MDPSQWLTANHVIVLPIYYPQYAIDQFVCITSTLIASVCAHTHTLLNSHVRHNIYVRNDVSPHRTDKAELRIVEKPDACETRR